MLSLLVDKQSDAATMPLYETLEQMDLPKDVNITINSLQGAESNILREEGRGVDISLVDCYSLGDVVRELGSGSTKVQNVPLSFSYSIGY